ncbi:MAG: hypothetical protein FJ009_21475 [Chloroflexi bacterium]|nr:hypothetical protein [Chloroflexota bacterium]
MASTLSRKRPRATARKVNQQLVGTRYLVNERGKRIAVVIDLAEYRRLLDVKRAPRPVDFDWLAEARRIRALSPQTSDSTPILRALREGKL